MQISTLHARSYYGGRTIHTRVSEHEHAYMVATHTSATFIVLTQSEDNHRCTVTMSITSTTMLVGKASYDSLGPATCGVDTQVCRLPGRLPLVLCWATTWTTLTTCSSFHRTSATGVRASATPSMNGHRCEMTAVIQGAEIAQPWSSCDVAKDSAVMGCCGWVAGVSYCMCMCIPCNLSHLYRHHGDCL